MKLFFEKKENKYACENCQRQCFPNFVLFEAWSIYPTETAIMNASNFGRLYTVKSLKVKRINKSNIAYKSVSSIAMCVLVQTMDESILFKIFTLKIPIDFVIIIMWFFVFVINFKHFRLGLLSVHQMQPCAIEIRFQLTCSHYVPIRCTLDSLLNYFLLKFSMEFAFATGER